MKKLIFLFVLSLASHLDCISQVIVEGKNINEMKTIKLCEVVGVAKFLSNKVTIRIDYGQKTKFASSKGTKVTTKSGNDITFNSVIDALNYMENNGWERVDSYTLTSGNTNVYHHLFRKKE